jgi:hypothetical protein
LARSMTRVLMSTFGGLQAVCSDSRLGFRDTYLRPVHLGDLPKVVCHEVPRPPFEIGPFRIRTALACHPGPTVGYRFGSFVTTPSFMGKREPQIILKTDERSIHLELGRGGQFNRQINWLG